MKHTLRLTAVAVAAALTLAACGSDESDAGGMGDMDMGSSSSSSDGSSGTGTPATGENNEADVMFAQGMIPHHAQAVEMSDMLLAKDGVDERVVELAQQIKDAQAPEIAQMTGWLNGWGEDVPSGDMDMGSGGMDMGGMMSPEEMQALEDAEGPEASRLFLEQMTEHHDGAIEMAETELADGSNPEAKELAQTIIDTQQAEIDEMQELLSTL